MFVYIKTEILFLLSDIICNNACTYFKEDEKHAYYRESNYGRSNFK